MAFTGSALRARNTSTSAICLPVSTSNDRTRIEPPRSLIAVVSQTRPPATTGDDHPSPGTRVFHTTLRDSLHSNGTPRSLECP